MENFLTIFSRIEDKRVERAKKHKLIDIIVIAFCAILCNAKGWYDIEEFGEAKEAWFRKFLDLPGGIPSHDTFARVFSALDPNVLEEKLMEWTRCVFVKKPENVIAVDGKTMRGTIQGEGKPFVHMVSAWSCENGVSLGQIAVDDKSNEITAMPKLLRLLGIEGAVVTSDAMGCQKEIAKLICDKGGDYILAAKGNHPGLFEEIKETAAYLPPKASYTETDCGHGRVETRTCYVYRDLSMISGSWNWAKLAAIVRVDSCRFFKKDGRETKETRYYLTSLNNCSAAFIASCIRQHWQVENNLHWMLDVCFQEDKIRRADKTAAENFSRMNRMALAVIKNAPSPSLRSKSIKARRFRASVDEDYLMQILTGI